MGSTIGGLDSATRSASFTASGSASGDATPGVISSDPAAFNVIAD